MIKNQEIELEKLQESLTKINSEILSLDQQLNQDTFVENTVIVTEEEVQQKKIELEQLYKNHKTAKILIASLDKKRDKLQDELEDIKLYIDEVINKKDDHYADFEFTVKKVKWYNEKYNDLLSQNIQMLNDQREQKEQKIQEIVEKAEIEPSLVENLSRKIEETLDAKNKLFKNLKYSLAHATKAYNDAVRV